MATRTFPSYWMYKDVQNKWRWTYHAVNGEAIAVSSESYNRRVDCENSINIMKGSSRAPVWLPDNLATAA
ncbi:YegP family protein [Ancylobacter defluvii]|uniref:DUF1508 domain-containing protein n=1 Tax=Ancylobacter defluvii TaxID=1282440 RepID=A0A9W6NAH8_9HYPH|nr:DUF1508 domain-containing protein [Ancylobacter defluvii]MBS7587172.1 DUF1508 domain-containing protein [Ancylobacter defluvii]GLK83486.1 hypothetical protein GCM10017653_15550 [Ancylobacter defluvii]